MMRKPEQILLEEIRSRVPSPRRIPDARREIREAHLKNGRVLVVLDDDPTGTQTVHDIDVLLEWDRATVEGAVRDADACFYISTNSRSLQSEAAAELNRELGRLISEAATKFGRPITIASRSDSTLRGHFPVEVEAVLEGMGQPVDSVLLAPAFFEGGRYTIENVHWVQEGAALVPAGETEFAKDPHFGFSESNLAEWVEEKTRGKTRADQVMSLSLELIRQGGVEEVSTVLESSLGGRYVIVNAFEESDLEVVSLALLRLEEAGKRFLFRCAASLVKVYAGLDDRPLLKGLDLSEGGPGLVMVGSYVNRTTEQLAPLLEMPNQISVEVPVDVLASGQDGDIQAFAEKVDSALRKGRTAVVFTSRVKKEMDGETFLLFGERVMKGLTALAAKVQTRPAFIVSKGGITSISIARQGLSASRARVLGQIAAGVPVWRIGEGAKWPGIPYVVFPGNVGTRETLMEAVTSLSGVSEERNKQDADP